MYSVLGGFSMAGTGRLLGNGVGKTATQLGERQSATQHKPHGGTNCHSAATRPAARRHLSRSDALEAAHNEEHEEGKEAGAHHQAQGHHSV